MGVGREPGIDEIDSGLVEEEVDVEEDGGVEKAESLVGI